MPRKPFKIKHPLSGVWYEQNGLRYPPVFASSLNTTDQRVLNSTTCKALYAGFEIHDTMPVKGGDVSGPERWEARPAECLKPAAPTIKAKTKSLVLEAVDRYFLGVRPRRHAPGVDLLNATGDC